MRQTPVPWAYAAEAHNDRTAFAKVFGELGVDQALLPFAIFLFREICYAGFAHNYSAERSVPTYRFAE